MNDMIGLQLMLHIVLSLVYICYILHFKPYKDNTQNYFYVQNEVIVLLCSMVLISTLLVEDLDLKYTIGYLYILFFSALILYNLEKILSKIIFRTIPESYREYKANNV